MVLEQSTDHSTGQVGKIIVTSINPGGAVAQDVDVLKSRYPRLPVPQKRTLVFCCAVFCF